MSENHERIVVELESFFFKTLYLWTVALYLNLLSFPYFLNLLSYSSQVFLLYTLCIWVATLALLMVIIYLQKKKWRILIRIKKN